MSLRVTVRRSGMLLSIAIVASRTAPISAQSAPKTGLQVLERMHAAYQATWYHTLTFVQKTHIQPVTGKPIDQIWYESLAAPSSLRLDFAPVDSGNGAIMSRDSTFVAQGGKIGRRAPGGNPFMPLIIGVYVQSPAETAKELAEHSMDVSKMMTVSTPAGPAWVVGTATPGDSTTPQFWVDPSRMIVTRIVAPLGPPGQIMRATVGGYEKIGKAWLATRIWVTLPGGATQEETYTDWHADVPLDRAIFGVSTWHPAPSWIKKGAGAGR